MILPALLEVYGHTASSHLILKDNWIGYLPMEQLLIPGYTIELSGSINKYLNLGSTPYVLGFNSS